MQAIPSKRIQIPRLDFPTFNWDKNTFLHLDTSHFPDSVNFFLPVDILDFDILDATLLEDVWGWSNECSFRYSSFGAPNGANYVIIEDVSASMGDYLAFTDRLIWGFVSNLPENDCEVALVRFGGSPERVLGWVLPDSFMHTDPEKLPYPHPRGSDLAGALEMALALIAERPSSPSTIVLFSDGDFEIKNLPRHLLERANRYNTTINIFMHGEAPRGALAEIASETKGLYLVQPAGGFSPGMVAAVMRKSYEITYFPVRREKDGSLHRVVFSDGQNKFCGEYRAPGKIPDAEILVERESEQIILPDKLLSNLTIPFGAPGNRDILPESATLLDEIANELNSLPDTLRLVIEIKGFACNLGTAGLNMRLSKTRAFCVKDYLSSRVNGSVNFDVSWFGEMYPLNGNANEDERRMNRRVEMSFRIASN